MVKSTFTSRTNLFPAVQTSRFALIHGLTFSGELNHRFGIPMSDYGTANPGNILDKSSLSKSPQKRIQTSVEVGKKSKTSHQYQTVWLYRRFELGRGRL